MIKSERGYFEYDRIFGYFLPPPDSVKVFPLKLNMSYSYFQERLRAEQLGYEDPINPNYEATSDMYHRCLAECMERMRDAKALGDGSEKRVGIMVASHNADTIRFAIEKMKEYDIKVTFLMLIAINW